MTAIAHERLTQFAGLIPANGTFGIKAGEKLYRMTLVARDSNNRAVEPTDGDGLEIIGVSNATYDNTDGGNDAINAELSYGVFEFLYTGTAPKTGDLMYSVDNQTVSTSSDTDQRGLAGYCVEKIDSDRCTVAIGPQTPGVVAALATVLGDVPDLLTDATTAQAVIRVPLASFRVSDGSAIPAFSNGVADGFALVDSKAFGLRINDDSTTKFMTSVDMPQDLDDAAAVVVHLLASKTGATLADATVFTLEAFFQTVGALHDADVDAGGDTGAMTGNAAAKTVAELTKSIAAGDVPASPSGLTLTLKVKNGTLATDDAVIHDVWIEYTRKLLAA